MKHEEWYDLSGMSPGEPASGSIKLGLHWVYSRVAFISDLIKKWDQTLENDDEQKKAIEEHLHKLRSPFGFLEYMGSELDTESDAGTGSTLANKALKGDVSAKMQMKEKQFSKKVDQMAK